MFVPVCFIKELIHIYNPLA